MTSAPSSSAADQGPRCPCLVQVNVARLRAPRDALVVRTFFDALAEINYLAADSPGHVWHLHDAGRGISEDERLIINISVWHSYAALHSFTYRSLHGAFVRHRDRWFEPMDGPNVALWWVTPTARPSLSEAMARLDHLRVHGATPTAFSLRRQFDDHGQLIARRTSLQNRGREFTSNSPHNRPSEQT